MFTPEVSAYAIQSLMCPVDWVGLLEPLTPLLATKQAWNSYENTLRE